MAKGLRLFLGFILPGLIVIVPILSVALVSSGGITNQAELKQFFSALVLSFITALVYVGFQSLAYTLLIEFQVRKKFFPHMKMLYLFDSGKWGGIAGFLTIIPMLVLVYVFDDGLHSVVVLLMFSVVMAIVGIVVGLISGLILWWVTKKLPD